MLLGIGSRNRMKVAQAKHMLRRPDGHEGQLGRSGPVHDTDISGRAAPGLELNG